MDLFQFNSCNNLTEDCVWVFLLFKYFNYVLIVSHIVIIQSNLRLKTDWRVAFQYKYSTESSCLVSKILQKSLRHTLMWGEFKIFVFI